MANTTIEVSIILKVIVARSPTHCAVVITNCHTRFVKTKWQKINDVPARFTDVPPGMYYVVVVPQGGNASQAKFRWIDGASDLTSITFDLSAGDTTGRITAIVLVGGNRAPGIPVRVTGRNDKYLEDCMTDINGEAVFDDVSETQIYDVVAYHGSGSEGVACDLTADPDWKVVLRFS